MAVMQTDCLQWTYFARNWKYMLVYSKKKLVVNQDHLIAIAKPTKCNHLTMWDKGGVAIVTSYPGYK